MRTESESSGVHRFQAATSPIDESIEERTVMLCQVESNDTSRRPCARRPRPDLPQAGRTLFRNTPKFQDNKDNPVRTPTPPRLRFDLTPDVFKDTLIKDQGG